ncbi:MAG: branched-chain amino acid ABC transporter permease [Chlamydiae bacterium]|nr:branched-chain amino acid ABC transporter permease [Chlamydiota bacterium]MBI3276825.1 branched-chain amino acid ABC transporter permease [Chlamydiota bacterium]
MWLLNGLIVITLLILQRVLTLHLNAYYFQILIYIGINIILAVSLNLINGQTGQFSIGHAGFMAIGAYVSASLTYYMGPWFIHFLTTSVGLPDGIAKGILFALALTLAGITAASAGLLVGLPILRLRGDYLAIATLGFGEIIRVLILNTDAVGGARGFTDIPEYTHFFWLGLLTYITLLVICNLIHSTKGRAFSAIREDEIAAESIGINTTKYKVGAFVIGSFFAGIAGCLFAHQVGYLHTNSFTFMRSIEIVVMVVLGGMSSITGTVIAAIVLTILPELLRFFSEFRMVLYSLILILLMLGRSGVFGNSRISKIKMTM